MSSNEPFGPASGESASQFGAPVNQFGTPVNQFGTPAAGMPAPAGTATAPFNTQPGWSQPAPAPARRSGGLGIALVAVTLAVLVAGGLLLRFYVFPDLSKPIALPDTLAGVGQVQTGPSQGVTLQTKDAEGHAVAMGVYADQPTQPRTMVVVTAGRVKNFNIGQITEPTSTVGKVTCTNDVDAMTLLQQSGTTQSPNAAALRGMNTGAACWRTGRHLTVLAVVLSATGPASLLASQAVSEAWDSI